MNRNGKLNAARTSGFQGSAAPQMRRAAKPQIQSRTGEPSIVNKVASTVVGGVLGVAGSVGGVMGSDPQRSSVPANTYGQKNAAYGRAYNFTSEPGSLIAKGYKKIGKALGR